MTPLQRTRRRNAIHLAALYACAVVAVVVAFFAGAAVGTEYGLSAIFYLRSS